MTDSSELKTAVLAYTAQIDGNCCAYGYLGRPGFHEADCKADEIIADLEKRFLKDITNAAKELTQTELPKR